MAEVNAAWWVLGNRARRAEFDRVRSAPDRLTSDRAGADGARRFASNTSRSAYPPNGVPDLEPEVEGAPTVVRHRRRKRASGPVVVAGALVVVVVVVLVLASLSTPQDPENVETTVLFPAGSCVQITQARNLLAAPCDARGAVRVVGREPFPQPCPTRTAAIVMLELNESVCVEQPVEPGAP
jgi:hypothetical protein